MDIYINCTRQNWEVSVYATPSTCFQFKPKVAEFTLDDDLPAYRWIELHEDGDVKTGGEIFNLIL